MGSVCEMIGCSIPRPVTDPAALPRRNLSRRAQKGKKFERVKSEVVETAAEKKEGILSGFRISQRESGRLDVSRKRIAAERRQIHAARNYDC